MKDWLIIGAFRAGHILGRVHMAAKIYGQALIRQVQKELPMPELKARKEG